MIWDSDEHGMMWTEDGDFSAVVVLEDHEAEETYFWATHRGTVQLYCGYAETAAKAAAFAEFTISVTQDLDTYILTNQKAIEP